MFLPLSTVMSMLCFSLITSLCLCYAMLCYAYAYAMLCYAMLCYVMLCYANVLINWLLMMNGVVLGCQARSDKVLPFSLIIPD